ncbi:FeoB-associated Cys-rich membrane protein [Rummeliibacillus sp. SL167]|uniref:FeoB-associated Cys-rich membrane protein n=1 Tax=Rummeliibacillus sp. SL167 TaxID=2579792 RepID=UPI0011B38D74|nr:FeoB-associated Cys-rich membrane protein [Rummeliibacillus sp. SL167]
MIANIVIGLLIFGYASWTIYRHVQKSKKGKCGSCELKSNCECCSPAAMKLKHTNH